MEETPCFETEEEQLELFPELPAPAPESLGVLKNGSLTMRFVSCYFLTGNATQSVLDAGYRCSRESARRMGSELLTRVDIRNALRHLSEQIRAEALVSKQNVISSILDTREQAKRGDVFGRKRLSLALDCDKVLAQIIGLTREDKVSVTNNTVGSLEEFRKLLGGDPSRGADEARA